MGITLVEMDILFILFRLPTLINTMIDPNGANKIAYGFIYSMFSLIGTMHNVFTFLIFIIFNKVYRKLYLNYMKKVRKFIKRDNRVFTA